MASEFGKRLHHLSLIPAILCKDIETGRWVLIENQLERTDHSHLGQLFTCASGLEAVTIVWIAAHFPKRSWRRIEWREGTAERLSSRFARVRVRVAIEITHSRKAGPKSGC